MFCWNPILGLGSFFFSSNRVESSAMARYRLSISPLYFLGGLLLVLAIVLTVVVLNCLKIARENPVLSLKNE